MHDSRSVRSINFAEAGGTRTHEQNEGNAGIPANGRNEANQNKVNLRKAADVHHAASGIKNAHENM